MYKVYLSLGSNIGDRLEMLKQACTDLSSILSDISFSHLYETEPQDYTEQDLFLNMVVSGNTLLDPRDLLEKIQSIETELGRVKTIDKGPRSIDIDILLYDDLIIDSDDLIIPHPSMINRQFVLKPLLDIDKSLFHPVTTKYFNEYYNQLEDQGVNIYCMIDTLLIT